MAPIRLDHTFLYIIDGILCNFRYTTNRAETPPRIVSTHAGGSNVRSYRKHVVAANGSSHTEGQRYRAVLLPEVGGPEVLQTVELPLQHPGPKQLRVRIRAAGVGSTDLMMLEGRYDYAPPMPFVPGYEIAGVVDAVGSGVENLRSVSASPRSRFTAASQSISSATRALHPDSGRRFRRPGGGIYPELRHGVADDPSCRQAARGPDRPGDGSGRRRRHGRAAIAAPRRCQNLRRGVTGET